MTTRRLCALAAGAALSWMIGLAVAPTEARAGDWTGAYLSIGGGYGSVNHELNLTPGPAAAGIGFDLAFDGIGGDGGFFSVGVGGDVQINQHVVIGGLFEYDWTRYESELTAFVNPGFGTLTAGADVEVEDQWSLGGRVGFLPSERTLWFLTFGYTRVDVSDLRFNVAVPGFAISDTLLGIDDFSGWFLGGGVETKLTESISLKAEYRYTSLDSEKVQILPKLVPQINDFVKADLEPTVQTGRIALVYRFNWHREPMVEPLK